MTVVQLLLGTVMLMAADPPPESISSETRSKLLHEFLESGVRPEKGGFIFIEQEFPRLVWDQPGLARDLWGELTLTVRWHDSAGREVTQPLETGRYAAYLESRSPEGPVVRQGKTFFRFDPAGLGRTGDEVRFRLPDSPGWGLSEAAWSVHREAMEDFGNTAILRALLRDEDGAILVAGIADWDEETHPDNPLDTPSIRHQEHHLKVKRRILGVETKYPDLQYPRWMDTPAPALTEGSPETAGLSPDLPVRLRVFSREWEEKTKEPFTMVVARRGVVVFHESFGQERNNPVDRDTSYPLLSITKSLTGVMAAIFLEQDLIDPDAPLGLILPDLPLSGPSTITARGCFMHVTGLEGQTRWGGINNPWLDNHAAHTLQTATPAYRYSGVAYDLVGMAMQIISGKSIPRLFHEHLFAPLGMKNAEINGLGIGARLRAIDLAKLGQLLLNGGSHGNYRFFREEALEQILPQSYEKHFPGLATGRNDYGFGLRWAGEPDPRAGTEGIPENAPILSGRTVGHGSLSGSIFRVDFENDLVIAVGRFRMGDQHGDYLQRLLILIAESLVD